MIEVVALAIIGAVAGLLAGLLGIGGGLVIVPGLTWLLVEQGADRDLAVPMAIASALGTMLLTSAASAWSHARRGNVDWHAVVRLGPAVALGALVGGWVASSLPGPMLARVFAGLVALVGLRMLTGAGASTRPVAPGLRGWLYAGPVIGSLSALIGIGGGSFNVPYLAWNGYSVYRAVGIAAVCGWPIALAGSTGFLLPGEPVQRWPNSIGYWYLPGVIVIGVMGAATSPLGARLAERVGSAGLARLFGLFLLLVAARMALD
jgi:uncharacterized membrane protein YfcA